MGDETNRAYYSFQRVCTSCFWRELIMEPFPRCSRPVHAVELQSFATRSCISERRNTCSVDSVEPMLAAHRESALRVAGKSAAGASAAAVNDTFSSLIHSHPLITSVPLTGCYRHAIMSDSSPTTVHEKGRNFAHEVHRCCCSLLLDVSPDVRC